MCIFSQYRQEKFCPKVFFVKFFFMYLQPSFQTYYELTQVERHIYLTCKNPEVGQEKKY
jgi:hypothetical protein